MIKKFFKCLVPLAALTVITAAAQATWNDTADGFGAIRNDAFRHTTDGSPLFSHGGGIFRFKDPDTGTDKYYWYGVRYRGSKEYMADPSVTVEHAVFDGVTCYSSTNLTDWTYEGDVLDRDEIAAHEKVSWVGPASPVCRALCRGKHGRVPCRPPTRRAQAVCNENRAQSAG